MRNLVLAVVAFVAVACGGTGSEPAADSQDQQLRAQSSPRRAQPAPYEEEPGRFHGKPFRGPSWGTTVSTVQYPIVHNVFTGLARLTGMGRCQVVFPHDWNLIDKSVTGLMTITAANGDELFASVTGTAVFRPDGLIADLDQFAIIEGGTGRFDGAEGSFSVVGTITRATGAVDVYLDGRLVRAQTGE